MNEVLNVGKVFIPYLWVVNDNGLITDTKFIKELDLNSVKPGDMIESFYGEKFILYNLSGTDYSLTESGPISIENIGQKEHLHDLVSQLVSEMKNVKIEDLHASSRGDKSIYERIVAKLNDSSIPVEDSIQFDLDRYIRIRNELVYEKSVLTGVSSAGYGALVRVFDGLLSSEGILKGMEGIALMKQVEEQEDSEEPEYMVHFSDIYSSLGNFEDFAYAMKKAEKPLFSPQKLKM